MSCLFISEKYAFHSFLLSLIFTQSFHKFLFRQRTTQSLLTSQGISLSLLGFICMPNFSLFFCRLRMSTGPGMRDCIRGPVLNQLRAGVWDQVRPEVWDQVRAGMRDQVRGAVRDSVRAAVRDQVRAGVHNRVRHPVWDQIRHQVWDQVRGWVQNWVWATVWD